MALQRSTTVKGIPMSESYNIVTSALYIKPDDRVYCSVRTYYNSGSRAESIDNFVDESDYKFQPIGSYAITGNDVSTACYTYLKTLPDWSGSLDV